MGLWVFQRHAPGALERLSLPDYEAFHRGVLALKADPEDRHVYFIDVGAVFRQRRLVSAHTVWFWKTPVLKSGKLSANLNREQMRLAMDSMDSGFRFGEEPSNVVRSQGRFAARVYDAKYRWEPQRADLDALHRYLDERAGFEVPWGRIISRRSKG